MDNIFIPVITAECEALLPTSIYAEHSMLGLLFIILLF